MAVVFYRGVALPLWAIVFFAVALTASSPVMSLAAVLGIVVIAFTIGGLVPRLCTARSVAHVAPPRRRRRKRAARR